MRTLPPINGEAVGTAGVSESLLPCHWGISDLSHLRCGKAYRYYSPFHLILCNQNFPEKRFCEEPLVVIFQERAKLRLLQVPLNWGWGRVCSTKEMRVFVSDSAFPGPRPPGQVTSAVSTLTPATFGALSQDGFQDTGHQAMRDSDT